MRSRHIIIWEDSNYLMWQRPRCHHHASYHFNHPSDRASTDLSECPACHYSSVGILDHFTEWLTRFRTKSKPNIECWSAEAAESLPLSPAKRKLPYWMGHAFILAATISII